MKKRLKHTGVDDFLMRAVEENLTSFPSNIINVEKQISLHDDMLSMLAEYAFDFERAPASPFGQNKMNEINSILGIYASQL